MAVVRDPAFWKRFSTAVHLDEEQKTALTTHDSNIKRSETWLARQRAKKSRRTYVCWAFWICFTGVVAGIAVTMIILKANGTLDNIKWPWEPSTIASTSTSNSDD